MIKTTMEVLETLELINGAKLLKVKDGDNIIYVTLQREKCDHYSSIAMSSSVAVVSQSKVNNTTDINDIDLVKYIEFIIDRFTYDNTAFNKSYIETKLRSAFKIDISNFVNNVIDGVLDRLVKESKLKAISGITDNTTIYIKI
jgi:hypothetical protein